MDGRTGDGNNTQTKKMGSRAKEQYQTKVFIVFFCSFSLNISILHRLRNKFSQLILISTDSASWELHQYSRQMCGLMKKSQSCHPLLGIELGT